MVSEHLFWDSCVFIRYLTNAIEADCFPDICRFMEESRLGKRRIYYSTLVMAEIRQEHFKIGEYGTIHEFFEDFAGAFVPIDPNPIILSNAGELRSVSSTNPQTGQTPGRVLGTADAIMLTTCLYARDALGISDVEFHSFDCGSGKSWEGKCVPLVGFEKWYPECSRPPLVASVCSLPRSLPHHPEPILEGTIVYGHFAKSKPGLGGK